MPKIPPSSFRSARPCRNAPALLAFLVGALTGLAIILRLKLIARWWQKNQLLFRRVALFNKHWTNRVTLPLAGRRASPYAVLRHRGRRTGQFYATPVITVPIPGSFVIPLVYGNQCDWYRNLQAAGQGTLQWRGNTYTISSPELVEMERVLEAFPGCWHWPLRLYDIQQCVQVARELQPVRGQE